MCCDAEQNLEKAQKDLAGQKLDLDEYKGKFELSEKTSAEICTSFDEAKTEVYRSQEAVKRYCRTIYAQGDSYGRFNY